MSAFAVASQDAVRLALISTGLCGGRVYDVAPEDTGNLYPFIEIGDGQTIPDDTTNSTGGSDDGVSEYVDVHVWSRVAARREMKSIIDGIHSRMHGVALLIVGRVSALAWVRTIRQLTDADGITRHAILSLEIVHRS